MMKQFARHLLARHLLAIASVALFGAAPSIAATIDDIKGPEKVVDGWVSTGGAGSFTDKSLQGSGAAWGDYNRVLVRFDLSGIDVSKYGLVRKAVLRLSATEADNNSGVKTAVAASNTKWSTSATFGSPDGKADWPVRAGFGNLDYAMTAPGRAVKAVVAPGKVDFDVTDIVERWLYQGVQNNGFIIATGPTIFGRPNAGTWRLAFASSESGEDGPSLIVEMEGTPPTPDTVHSTALALYPSPLHLPVKSPYIFVWYGVGKEKLWEKFSVSNMSTYNGRPDWLAQRGVMFLTWGEGGPSEWMDSEKKWADYYQTVAASGLGYCMHEWHLTDTTPAKWPVNAVRQAEREHPATYSAFFFQGQKEMATAQIPVSISQVTCR